MSWSKSYDKSLMSAILTKQDIKDKSFDIVKCEYETYVMYTNELPVLSVKQTNEYHIIFDTKINQLEIKYNDKLVSNKQTNIQRALRYVDLLLHQHNIFVAMSEYLGVTSAFKIVYQLYKNPIFEIFYSTYKNLSVIQNISISEMDISKTRPHEIVQLSRPVWKQLLSLQCDVSYINKYYDTIKDLDMTYKKNPDYVVDILKIIPIIKVTMLYTYLSLLRKGYNHHRLYQYLTDDIYTHQGISNASEGLELLSDYIDMCDSMNVPYEKYPKSLKLMHDLAVKNYTIHINHQQQERFQKVVNNEQYQKLSYIGIDFSVIIPSTTNDIVNEGRFLHHCVESYINKVINGETKILFLRHNKSIDKPLVTLEVCNHNVKQYKGNCNRLPTEIEMQFIKEWATQKQLYV